MKCSLGVSNFLEEIASLPILLFFSFSLHCSLRKPFLSLLVTLWNSAFRWVYLSFSLLPLASLLYSAIFKATSIQFSSVQFSSVQLLSHVQLFLTPLIAAHQASLSITNSRNLLKLMSIESMMPSKHLIFFHPLLLLPPIPPCIRVISNESTPHEVAKVLEFKL